MTTEAAQSPASHKTNTEFVFCADGEGEDANKMELTTEDDGSLSLTQLASAFPGATGLKFKNPKTGAFRVVALDAAGTHFLPPSGDWGETMYHVIIKPVEVKQESTKRKANANGHAADDDETAKYRKLAEAASDDSHSRKCIDLLVLSLPFTLDSEGLKEHFEKFGKVAQAEIKADHTTGRPRGFGFVRMEDYDAQLAVLDKSEHEIGGRSCTVKIPWDKKDERSFVSSPKIFVGRVTEKMTQEDIRSLFEEEAIKIDPHGHVTDVFIPKPFRAFAFVTFNKLEVTQQILKKEHFTCLDCPVFAGPAVRKTAMNPAAQHQQAPSYGYAAQSAYNQWPAQSGAAGYHSGTYGTSQYGAGMVQQAAVASPWGDAYTHQAMTNQPQPPPYNGPAGVTAPVPAPAPSASVPVAARRPAAGHAPPKSQLEAQKLMNLDGLNQEQVDAAWQAFWGTISRNNPAATQGGAKSSSTLMPPGTQRNR